MHMMKGNLVNNRIWRTILLLKKKRKKKPKNKQKQHKEKLAFQEPSPFYY